MSIDPGACGRSVARFFGEQGARLFDEILEAGVLGEAVAPEARAVALREWECFALYACVRGLVAGGGFNRETAAAIDVLHDAAVPGRMASAGSIAEAELRAVLSARYEEYGTIGQAGGASGAATVTRRLGEAAARHMVSDATPTPELVETVGDLHEALVEGVAELVRSGT